MKKVNDRYLKQKGIDAHDLKSDTLGTDKGISRYGIYLDKSTGQLWVFRKGGKGIGEPTGVFIK